jgi:hypothetical protein
MMHKCISVMTVSVLFAWSNHSQADGSLYFSNSYISELKYLTKQESLQSFSHQLESEFEYTSRHYSLNAIFRMFADTEDNLSFSVDELDNYSDASKPYVEDKYGLNLRELYATFYVRNHTLKLGKQQVAWGETDGIRILDIINPLDYREFLLKDSDDIRIPIWMLNYLVEIDSAQLQLLLIPDNTTSHLSTRDYMVTTPISSPAYISQGDVDKVTSMQYSEPDQGVKSWDRAVNVSFSTQFGDFSLVYINQLNDIPVVESAYIDGEIHARQFFYRRNVGGVSYSTALDSWVLRSELAYSDARYVHLDQPGGLDKRSAFDFAIALDWSGLDDTTVTLQVSQDIVSGKGGSLTRDKVESTAAVVWDQYFINQTYQLRLLRLASLNRYDTMTTVDLDWLVQDNFTLGVGLDYFSGDRQGTFGQYKDVSRARITLEYTF